MHKNHFYVNHWMLFFETCEMMYVSRMRTKQCDGATENMRQLSRPLRFQVCLRQKYCLSQIAIYISAKNSKPNGLIHY